MLELVRVRTLNISLGVNPSFQLIGGPRGRLRRRNPDRRPLSRTCVPQAEAPGRRRGANPLGAREGALLADASLPVDLPAGDRVHPDHDRHRRDPGDDGRRVREPGRSREALVPGARHQAVERLVAASADRGVQDARAAGREVPRVRVGTRRQGRQDGDRAPQARDRDHLLPLRDRNRVRDPQRRRGIPPRPVAGSERDVLRCEPNLNFFPRILDDSGHPKRFKF